MNRTDSNAAAPVLSPSLAAALASYAARISAAGGYGATVTGRTPDGKAHTGTLFEGGFGGFQPMIRDAAGRSWRVDLGSLAA